MYKEASADSGVEPRHGGSRRARTRDHARGLTSIRDGTGKGVASVGFAPTHFFFFFLRGLGPTK